MTHVCLRTFMLVSVKPSVSGCPPGKAGGGRGLAVPWGLPGSALPYQWHPTDLSIGTTVMNYCIREHCYIQIHAFTSLQLVDKHTSKSPFLLLIVQCHGSTTGRIVYFHVKSTWQWFNFSLRNEVSVYGLGLCLSERVISVCLVCFLTCHRRRGTSPVQPGSAQGGTGQPYSGSAEP